MMAAILFLRITAVMLALLQTAAGQSCYYPDGTKAPPTEKPCSSGSGVACCPDTWECMDNGLCYNPADKFYGRYSCTDKTWKSQNCPSNLCTDSTNYSAEGVTQCPDHDNQWCCNADNIHVNCCESVPTPRPFFALQDPKAYGTIGGKTGTSAPILATITGKGVGSGTTGQVSTSTFTSSSQTEEATTSTTDSSSSSLTTQSTPLTSLLTSVSTGSTGVLTIVQTVTAPAESSTSTNGSPPPDDSDNTSKVGLIVGCAVGIPLAFALIGILTWMFRKRAQQKAQNLPNSSSVDAFKPEPAMSEFAGGAKLHKRGTGTTKYASADPGVPELAGGQGVGPERPISMIPGKAEMDSGGHFAPGTVPQAAHLVGVGGGNGSGSGHSPVTGHATQSSWGTAPPGYSPAHNQQAWSPTTNADPMAGRYQAYHPPPDMVAELPTVRTPPEAAEMGNPSPPTGAHVREYPGMAEAGSQAPKT